MLKCILAGRGSRDEGANRSEGGLYKLLTGAARCRRLARAPRRGCAVPGRGGSPAPSPRCSGPRRAKQLWPSGHRRGGAFFPFQPAPGGAGGSLATASLQAGQGPPAPWRPPGLTWGSRGAPGPSPSLLANEFPIPRGSDRRSNRCKLYKKKKKKRVAAAGCSPGRAAGCAAGSRGCLGGKPAGFLLPPHCPPRSGARLCAGLRARGQRRVPAGPAAPGSARPGGRGSGARWLREPPLLAALAENRAGSGEFLA